MKAWLRDRFRDPQRSRETLALFAMGGCAVNLVCFMAAIWTAR